MQCQIPVGRDRLCTHRFTHGMPKEVAKHMEADHPIQVEVPENLHTREQKALCPWKVHQASGFSPCRHGAATTEILLQGMARHIATVHLNVFKEECDHCGRVLSRKDAVVRHIWKSCTKASPEAKRQAKMRDRKIQDGKHGTPSP